jgi:hypothetical protein
MVAIPVKKSERNVFVLYYFAESGTNIVWNQENWEQFIVGNAFVQQAFAGPAVSFAEN